MDKNRVLRRLPSVEAVLSRTDVQSLMDRFPRAVVLEGVRRALEVRRQELLRDGSDAGEKRVEVSGNDVSRAIQAWTLPGLRPVINATGVILHTNLGRAPLSADAVAHVTEVAEAYSNLEMNLKEGIRGRRMDAVRGILLELTGAEDALVVNNNAAAVYLGLRTLGGGREVIVSRGELVEIGGSFRIPDVMAASGARLVEVGTTNKTRLDDYRRAIGPDTALLLKVHRSNFAVVGFTEEASLSDLSGLAREAGLPLMLDMGWGTLLRDLPSSMQGEETPRVAEALDRGADLVCFSGDKMLGGPQSGILLGKKRWVRMLARDPMARALRVDKLTLAALWATLAAYRGGDAGARRVPVVDMLLSEPDALRRRAEDLLGAIRANGATVEAEVVPSAGQVGGGSLPLTELPGYAVALRHRDQDAETLAERLRNGNPPVLARRHQERVFLDVRTLIGNEQISLLADAVGEACSRK